VLTILWAVLFVLAVLVFWLTNLFGLPGNWLIVAIAALYAWLAPPDSRAALDWPAVGVVAGLAAIGEILEFAASAAGVKKVGGSRRGAFYALVGSLAGAIVGMFVGIPIPIVGSIIAAVVFAGLGALVGAMIGEMQAGKSMDASLTVGKAAFWGRLYGTVAKVVVGALMAFVIIVAVMV
jgi:uncharacterized protein YqgC (DUF456 family)